MRCVLVGNYGVGNVGDEALKEYFLTTFPDVEWTTVSGDWSKERGRHATVPRLPLGIRSLWKPWWKTVGAIAKADAVVFGGGSLFTDVESVWACVLWSSYALVSQIFRTPYFLAFQGVGPFRTSLGGFLARAVFSRAAFVSVRDEASEKRVRLWALGSSVLRSFDPAFAFFAAYPKSAPKKKVLLVIPRSNADERFFQIVRSYETASFDEIRILLLQPDAQERSVAHRIRSLLDGNSTVIEVTLVEQLLKEMSQASAVVTQRFHAALAAYALDVSCTIVSQQEGDKLAALSLEMLHGAPGKAMHLAQIQNGTVALISALKAA